MARRLTFVQICFQKRKRGLLKKAMEIVMLTDSQVILTIFDPIECRVTNFTNFPNLEH